jgi:tetratricopeptide (TPR) repeat protein
VASQLAWETPSELKQKGNELFRKGDISEALPSYLAAVRECCAPEGGPARDVPVLLSSRAQCNLALGNHATAFVDASVAVLLSPHHAKSHYRRTLALLNLEDLQRAEASCVMALKALPVAEQKALLQLQTRITAATAAKEHWSTSTEPATVEKEKVCSSKLPKLSV